MGLWDQIGLRAVAFPFGPTEALKTVSVPDRDTVSDRTRSAAFLHLWQERFRCQFSNALDRPPDGSFLASLYDRHGVARAPQPERLATNRAFRFRVSERNE
jgi:hypothetical protein